MVACLATLLLGASAAILVAQADKYPTVFYKKAADHMGEIVWVEGTVLKVVKEAEGTYLAFHRNEKYIRVLVPTKYLSNFEGGFKHRYVGKKIKAIGKVDKAGTQLIVGINEPKRIKVIEEET
jgi:hypothetical protein